MKTHAKTRGLKRFLCGLTALATAALMVPLSAMAGVNSDGPYTNEAETVTIDKGATNLDSNNQTTVTLDIQAGTTEYGSDVVFVLDKSTSTLVKEQALLMLDELMEKAGQNEIKVGVVTFNNNANNENANLTLTPLNSDSKSKVENVFNVSISSGTNIEAGISKGIEMLQADNTVPDSNKHLVLVTDGVSYLWGTRTPKTVYVEFDGADNSTPIWSSNSTATSVIDKTFFKITQEEYVNSMENPVKWMNDNATGIEATLEYEEDWTGNDWTEGMKYISKDENTSYTSNDVALYKAGRAWQQAATLRYNLYSYASDDYYNGGHTDNLEGHYPWAAKFFSNFNLIGGYSTIYSDTANGVNGMFNNVSDTILYTIANGTVTDIIGHDFNFAGLSTVKLTVNGEAFEPRIDEERQEIQFFPVEGYPNGSNRPHSLFSYSVNQQGQEVITWHLVREVSGKVSLSYKLNLDLESTNLPQPGNSTKLPTNESANLTYTDSNKNSETIDFPVPYVPVNTPEEEEEPDTPVIDPTPTPTYSLRITKVWENDDPEDRPDSITYIVYKDGFYHGTETLNGRHFGDRDTWRDDYFISADEFYDTDADWQVVEVNVAANYDSEIEKTGDRAFTITNTYEEPVVIVEESSEPSSKPSEPSSEITPSVEPSEPSVEPSEPVSDPEPAKPTLPQTGQLWWPVVVLLAGGAVLVAFGAFRNLRGNGRRER